MEQLWDSVYQIVGNGQTPDPLDTLHQAGERRNPDKVAKQREEHNQLMKNEAKEMEAWLQTKPAATAPGANGIPKRKSTASGTSKASASSKASITSKASVGSRSSSITSKKSSKEAKEAKELKHHHISKWSLFSHRRGSDSSFWDDLFGNHKHRHHHRKKEDDSSELSTIADEESTITPNGADANDPLTAALGGTAEDEANYPQQVADKLMQRLLSMAIPTTTTQDESELKGVLFRIEIQKSRPAFNVQTLSRNTIWTLQRLSVPFSLIDQTVIILTWKNPIYTLSFLLAVTLLILQPILLVSMPLFLLCFEVIVPAFLKRHPLDPSDGSITEGPQLKSVQYPQPVPELSREFLLNLTDLQNAMMLYITPWNNGLKWTKKYLYFRHEQLTTAVFLGALATGVFVTMFGTPAIIIFLPLLKFASIVTVWLFLISLHPRNSKRIQEFFHSEDTRLRWLSMTNNFESKIDAELDFTEDREVRQLEVYELQKLDGESKTWEPMCFTNDICPPNSHLRLNGLAVPGCSSLLNVEPPAGWSFVNDVTTATHMGKSSSTFSQISTMAKVQASELLEPVVSAKHRRTSSNERQPLSAAKEIYGWYMDLQPEEWARENYVDEVLEVDPDTKWAYDLVTKVNVSGVSSLGLSVGKKTRGHFRRRRWVRYVIRDCYKHYDETSDENDEEDDDDDEDEDEPRSTAVHSELPTELQQEDVDTDVDN